MFYMICIMFHYKTYEKYMTKKTSTQKCIQTDKKQKNAW